MRSPLSYDEIIKILRIKPLKRLSQNFLLDENITSTIASRASVKNCNVVEVGSGPGSITRSIILEGCSRLDCVEVDKRFIKILQEIAQSTHTPVHVHKCDIFKFNYSTAFDSIQHVDWNDPVLPKARILGNLPFNISIGLLLQYMKAVSERTGPFKYGRIPMYLSFQKEVADNLVSQDVNETSRLTIICQAFCSIRFIKFIHRTHFTPQPNVDVVFVELIPRQKALTNVYFDIFEQVVKGIFQYPNKHIINSLTFFMNENKEYASKLLEYAEINHSKTPRSLTINEWSNLSESYIRIMTENGLPLIIQPVKSPPPIST